MSHDADPVLIVVPCRDFAKGWPRFVAGWRDGLTSIGKAARFVVVDDGRVEPIAETGDADVVVMRHESAQGLGQCLRSALADHPLGEEEPALIIVPEFGYRPADARELFNAYKDVDMVIGVRPGSTVPAAIAGSLRVGGWLRKWLFGIPDMTNPPWYGAAALRRRWSYRFQYGPKLQDPECGLVLVKRSILERCPLQSSGDFAILELIAKANFLGAPMAEVLMSKPSDMPVMKGRFERNTNDEKIVFRRPSFRERILTAENAGNAE